MRAIKLKAQIGTDHTLHLQLPDDVDEGPAEVIVLVEGDPEPVQGSGTVADFLATHRVTSPRSKEEIDSYLRTERDSWE